MKVSSLLAILNNFESAAAVAAGSTTPALTAFGRLFDGYVEKNVPSLVNTLIKHRDTHGHGTNTPSIAKLTETLTKLEACLRSAEAKRAADDVAKLVEFVVGCPQANVEALVSEARGWLLEAGQPKRSSASRARRARAAPVEETLPPADYGALLKQSAKNNAQFDQVIARLRTDRRIKKTAVREIARLFLGYELAKKKGREDALMEIVERQAVEARQDARGSLLDRLKSW